MTTKPIVMVHGAWGGSYGFRRVRPPLHDGGHEVFTPSLTGIGERSHLTHPGINLSTHVRDVVNCVLYEDLDDIVLLGFSYGGMVVSGALEHIGSRISDLVYLDAFVPDDGDSVMTLRGDDGLRAPIGLDQSWLIPPIPRTLRTPEETAWSDARRSMQPIGTFTEPVQLALPLEQHEFSLTYVKATNDPGEAPDSAFWQAARRADASPSWSYHEIATNHLIPMTHPEELAAILSHLAATQHTRHE